MVVILMLFAAKGERSKWTHVIHLFRHTKNDGAIELPARGQK